MDTAQQPQRSNGGGAGMTVRDAFNAFTAFHIANGSSDRTIQSYAGRLQTFLEGYGSIGRLHKIADLPASIPQAALQRLACGHGERPVTAVTAGDVDYWLLVHQRQRVKYAGNNRSNEKGRLSEATKNGRKQALKTFWRFCQQRGYVASSPAAHVRKKSIDRGERGEQTRRKMMALEDLQRIVKVAQKRARNGQPRDLALVSFLAETGARPGEVISLTLERLDLDSLEATVNGKTGRRVVVFGPVTRDALQAWLDFRQLVVRVGHNADPEAVFVSISPDPRHAGKRMTTHSIHMAVRKLGERAGVDGICSPYSIRHLYGTHFALRAPLPLVQQGMGHADVSTTQTYVHPDRDGVKAMVATHSPLLAGVGSA